MNVWNASFEAEFGIANMFDLELEGGFTDDEVTLVATSNDRNANINNISFANIIGSPISVTKTQDAVSPDPLTGNQFITFNDLFLRLQEAAPDFDIAVAISGNRTFSFTTTNLESTLITFAPTPRCR